MDQREYQQIINKQRVLPSQYQRALDRVRHIECELHRYGLAELIAEARKPTRDEYLTNPVHIDRAWDREIEILRIKNGELPNG